MRSASAVCRRAGDMWSFVTVPRAGRSMFESLVERWNGGVLVGQE